MEHPEQIVDPDTAANVESWIPLARPVGPIAEVTPPPNPRDEILLLSQTRGSAVGDMVLFVLLFLPIALLGEFAIGTIYRILLTPQFPDETTLNSAIGRAALFPAIGWRTLVATGVIVWLTRRRNLSSRSVGLTTNRLGLNFLLGFLAFLAIMASAIALGVLIQVFFPDLTREFEKNADMIMDAVPKVSPAMFFWICLAIGYYEELIFRGFLMPRIRRATHSWTLAVIGNSAIFIPLHLQDQAPAALLAIGALSLTFSILTIWRRSLVPAILAHALFDFTMFLNLYYSAGDKWK